MQTNISGATLSCQHVGKVWPGGAGLSTPALRDIEDARFRRYQVNVIVDHSEQRGAPVIYEDNPTHQSLVGRVEHLARFGALNPAKATDANPKAPRANHKRLAV